jgi:6-pyruvoyl-tetrahydropterin synthase
MGEKRGKELKYTYTVNCTIDRKHGNFAYKKRQEVEPHRHDFRVELELQCKKIRKCKTGDNNYQLDLSIIQNNLKEFLGLLSDNLNEDNKLGKTSCSAEDILDFVGIYFLKYLNKQGVKNIEIQNVKVWETGETAVSLSGKKLRKTLKKTRSYLRSHTKTKEKN